MKKFYFLLILPILSFSIIYAENVNFTGTVSKTGGGPLKDVIISLAGVGGISAKSDYLGNFTLLSPSNVVIASKYKKLNLGVKGRDLIFYSISGDGNITVFSAQGKQLASKNFSILPSQTRRITLPFFAR